MLSRHWGQWTCLKHSEEFTMGMSYLRTESCHYASTVDNEKLRLASSTSLSALLKVVMGMPVSADV